MSAHLDDRQPGSDATESSLDVLVERMSDLVEAGRNDEARSLIDQHPEHVLRLCQLQPAIEALALFNESDGESADQSFSAIDPTTRRLGDFRIVREIGRGGMGVVYEAEQLSIGRRVALKVLPLAATLSAQQLQRFKNEARTAATLKHPQIVGVLTVGVERGVHYYTMELIEGRSLAEAIAEMRRAESGLHPELEPPSDEVTADASLSSAEIRTSSG